MYRTDILSGNGGLISVVKYTLTYSDLTTAGTSQTISLSTNPGGNSILAASTTAPPNSMNFQVPQAGVMLYYKMHHTVAFAGTNITAMTVSLGKLGGSNTFISGGSAFNVFQAVADTTLAEGFAVPSAQVTAWGVTATFTATGANVNAATAGSVDLYVVYLNISSPNE